MAEQLNSVVEFFSFSCSHCLNVEPRLQQILKKTNATYIPVVIAANGDQVGTAMTYYAAIRKGLGWQFRDAYWAAVSNGMQPYAPQTLIYVLGQITNDPNSIMQEAKSVKVQEKIAMDNQLISKYHVSSTPSFLINNQFMVEGEDALNGYLK